MMFAVAEGLGNREIAQQLNLSEYTVKNYLFRIFDQLGVSNRVELVLYAVSQRQNSAVFGLAGANKRSFLGAAWRLWALFIFRIFRLSRASTRGA